MAAKENESPNIEKGLRECHHFIVYINLLIACITISAFPTSKNTLYIKRDLLYCRSEGLILAAIGKSHEVQLIKGIKLELKGGDKIDSRILVSIDILSPLFC